MLWYFFALQMPEVKVAAAVVLAVAGFLNPTHFVDVNSLLTRLITY
jgi:hypothetical protein